MQQRGDVELQGLADRREVVSGQRGPGGGRGGAPGEGLDRGRTGEQQASGRIEDIALPGGHADVARVRARDTVDVLDNRRSPGRELAVALEHEELGG